METRAPYAVIGLFMLAAIAAVFGFVYWLHTTAGLQARAIYRVRFENTVSGLLSGAAVLFNGIRVGEVIDLQLDPENPRRVLATIAVAAGTPIRVDTQAGLDFQGLTGVPVVTLQGGARESSPWAAPQGEPPILTADPIAGQNMTQAAREALHRIDVILADNAAPLHDTIANLSTFSGALARNSDRLDGIIAGLERMTGAAPAKPPPPTYELTAARTFPPADHKPRGQLVIPDPTAPIAFDTRRLLVRTTAGESAASGDGQWSDNLPKLVQAKVVQSFENANYLAAVARPLEGLTADYQLLLDIRNFQISVSKEAVADVEFSAKILGDKGRIVGARIFHATARAETTDASGAAGALDEAFGIAATELVVWTSGII